ncbi:MAG TPA: CPBP family intramembrane glutamic endopeptidase [Gemmatimonadaceae bacterium]
MPHTLEFGVTVLAIVGASFYGQRVFWPRFRQAIARGQTDVRLRAYRHEVATQWVAAGIVAALWIVDGRSWSALRLTPPSTIGWLVSLVIVLSMIAFTLRQMRHVAGASLQRVERIRAKVLNAAAENPKMEFLMPRTADEYRWFLGLSLTAGVCEELICRGYFTWLLTPWLGAVGAVAVVSIGFGMGHAYQGWAGVVKTATVGAVMGAIMLVTGWLIPAMIVHALLDAGSGTIVFRVLRDGPAPDSLDGARVIAKSATP